MLLWVNVHGGFILGLVLLVLFGCARIWAYLTTPSAANRKQIIQLAFAVLCLLGSYVADPLRLPTTRSCISIPLQWIFDEHDQ